jgi:glycosyltransferase involved in cell wall biosynthesis
MAALPFASVVIPTHNEERSIRACLDAVIAQDYPSAFIEVLVLDGGSGDRTRAIVEDVAARAPIPIRLMDNPARSVPAALNRALTEARGEYLVRVDAHSEPEPSYVRRSVEGNLELDADLAGGWVEAVGTTAVGRAVAVALRSPFAMGYAVSWRRPEAPREVVSLPCGSYRIASLRRIGGFDEGQKANQDYEANHRLRQAGGKIVLLPDVRFRYVTRSSLRALARQFVRYGFYKARTMAKHPSSVRPRHLVPALALLGVAGLVAVSLAVPAVWWSLLVLGAVYLVALAVAAATAGRGLGRDALLLPLVFATIHAAWGVGNLTGLVRWFPARRSLR